ncbi:RBBP9/YdeN family alpha/beta hydrolase [Telmatospirillum siberiense]|uniref:Alpha/beta hydrolase n=1 Tax=Telmatospirillum siberiense TaxID=382514 RepID=A0A2N3PVD4_9PROT|nr:alpha/beta hydrolase [Telmatospirillum siberiense]PKU24363.1 alpha/beta hydrolase [Telmatospirillum siberiense]
MRQTTMLILPGLGDSGLSHWQTLWQISTPGARRVEQEDYENPVLSEWIDNLQEAVVTAPSPVVLVAHSLGCALVAHWSRSGATGRVIGAMLVAPADVEQEARTPPATWCLAPLPRDPLPFPTKVIASRDDSYVDVARAREFAEDWRAEFIDIGRAGHINGKSGLGAWPEGRHLLNELLLR